MMFPARLEHGKYVFEGSEVQPEKISNPGDISKVRDASQNRIKGRILFIDATTPEPDKDSGSVRLTNLTQATIRARDEFCFGQVVSFFSQLDILVAVFP